VGSAENKPSLLIEGGIHAREWIATATILFIVHRLLQESKTEAVAALLRDYVVSAIAPVNVDGYVYSWTTNRMWRKTRSDRPATKCKTMDDGVGGVDANRNWGYSWSITRDKAYAKRLADPCNEVFIGPKEFSEPEVRAVADYMIRRQQHSFARRTSDGPGPGYVAAFLDYHSYAQVLLPPWAYTAETPAAPDGPYQTGVTGAMTAAMANKSGRHFKAGADAFPPDPGTGPDWAYGYLGIRATMTVELEGKIGNIGGGFCLPHQFIRDVGQEQFAGFLGMARYLRLHGDAPSTQLGLFTTEDGVPDLQVKTSTLATQAAAATASGLGSTIAIVGALLLTLSAVVGYRRWHHNSQSRQLFRAPSDLSSTVPSWQGDSSPTSAIQIGRA